MTRLRVLQVSLCIFTAALPLASAQPSPTPSGAARTPPATLDRAALRTFTISTWIRPTASASRTDRIILERAVPPLPEDPAAGSESRLNFQLGLDAQGRPSAGYHEDGAGTHFPYVKSPAATTIGTNWTHIAAAYNGHDIRLYIDGELATAQVSLRMPYTGWVTAKHSVPGLYVIGAHDPVADGVSTNLTNHLSGLIDEVSVWNTALSQSDIQRYMTTLPTGTEPNLLEHWTFDDQPGAGVSGGCLVVGE